MGDRSTDAGGGVGAECGRLLHPVQQIAFDYDEKSPPIPFYPSGHVWAVKQQARRCTDALADGPENNTPSDPPRDLFRNDSRSRNKLVSSVLFSSWG